MSSQDHLLEQVTTALAEESPLYIQGGNSKAFYGNKVDSPYALDMTAHTGIVAYEPSELCVTVRTGTSIKELEAELAKNQQMLPFEPPLYTDAATIGGTVAAGLSGPRRPYSGAVRDAILGMKIINGKGEIISFGGQVMKNVAGYDVSRLITGSLGTLGVILEVSLRLLPKPVFDTTIQLPSSYEEAIRYFALLRTAGLPVTASSYLHENIYLRISGSQDQISNLMKKHSWQTYEKGEQFWESIRNHTHPFFKDKSKPLWRLSIAPSSPPSAKLNDDSLIEWGGGLRWIASNTPPTLVRTVAKKKGGHAILFRGDIPGEQTFPTPEPALFNIYKNIKQQLDPKGIFNPGRMYEKL